MTCPICLDLFYKCYTVKPCFHEFCAPCLSQHIKNSKKCPVCEEEMAMAIKNYDLSEHIDLYLRKKPTLARSLEHCIDLDHKDDF